MPQLLPFRDYDEHDVVNLFAWSGAIPVNRGTFVKAAFNSGWRTDEADLVMLGSPGAQYPNTVSQRYGTYAAVTAAGTGDYAIGMLLWDVKEQDENGELLKFKAQKAAEMQVALSGQTVPIVTRGLFLWSGTIGGTTNAGLTLYPGANGNLTTVATNQNVKLGKLLGAPNGKGHALIHLNVL